MDVVRFTSKSTGEVHVYRFVRTAERDARGQPLLQVDVDWLGAKPQGDS